MIFKRITQNFLLLLTAMIAAVLAQAQNGACPSGADYSPNNTWVNVEDSDYLVEGANSDWFTVVKWKYLDDDNAFLYIYDDETDGEPPIPLLDTDLLTYIGNRGAYNVVNTGRVPGGPNNSWCAEIASSLTVEDDDSGDRFRFNTLSAFMPTGLAIKNEGAGFTQITLKWTKGTDAPDNKHQYILFLDGSPVDTIAGGLREYTFEGLSAGQSYDLGVKTRIPAGSLSFPAINLPTGNWNYTSYGTSVSPLASINASTQGLTFTASQGTYSSKVRLEWDQLKGNQAAQIRVERSKNPPNQAQFEERNLLSGGAISYEDLDAIPGYIYTYRLTVLDPNNAAVASFSTTGYRKANGIIRGEISTTNRVGIRGVRVCAKPANPVSVAGAYSLPDPDSGYCTTTTISGRFELRNLYYYDSATFIITPYLEDHTFDPPFDEAILDLTTTIQSGFSFIDTTAIAIGGKVFFPPASAFGADGTDTIPLAGASILVDTVDYGIKTDAQGRWQFAVLDTGQYRFRISYPDHTFNRDLISTFIGGDSVHLDFIDLTVDSIKIRAQDGCGDPVADSVLINVTYDIPVGSSFFRKVVKTDPLGFAQVTLPATKFRLEVAANNPALDAANANPNVKPQFLASPHYFNLAFRDSFRIAHSDSIFVTRADSTVRLPDTSFVIPGGTFLIGINEDSIWIKPQPTADFLYYGPIKLWIDWESADAEITRGCTSKGITNLARDSVIVVQSSSYYPLDILMIDSIKNCPVDTGRLVIFDYVGDKERTPVVLPISNGKAKYVMEAGVPNSADGGAYPYQKAFFMYVYAGSRPGDVRADWVLVEGTQELTPTFTTRSPEIPDLIVHDPPGDASYSWVEKGSSRSIFQTVQFQQSSNTGLGDGIWVDAVIGGKVNKTINAPWENIGISFGAGLVLSYDRNKGVEQNHQRGYNYTYSFTDRFSTSSDPLFTGHEGDVYIGKATNQRFSIAEVLLFDETSCTTELVKKPNLELTGIATTFNYTEKHIKNVLLPQLNFLEITLRREASREIDQSKKEELISQADSFSIDIINWKRILKENEVSRDSLADYVENISFAAGAPVERTITSIQDTVATHEYLEFVDQTFKIGGTWIFDFFFWTEGSAGTYSNSRIVSMPLEHPRLNNDTTYSGSLSVGYHFDDTDFGDFFSVDILRDKTYNVPAFRLFAGTSSCPHEEGTQPRDKAQFKIYPPQIDNIDIGESALFSALLTNKSESYESREYHVRVIPATNPDGAEIRLGGTLINGGPQSFFLDSLANELVLEVKQGPRANSYERIGLMMYPPCEYDIWQNNGSITGGDTAWITVNFKSECSAVSIVEPDDNWFINATTGTELVLDIGGYDRNNKYLESITLQYRREGSDWEDGPSVAVNALVEDLYRLSLDFDNLPDGKYWIRAQANCRNGKGITRSSEVVGIVDRNSLAPFGKPAPTDGYLRKGQDIFVLWDQPMDTALSNTSNYPNAPEISLVRTDNDQKIPFSIEWSNDSLKMYIRPAASILENPAYAGREFEARVTGLRSGLSPNFEPQAYGLSWNFLFNESPVFWEPNFVDGDMFTGIGTQLESSLQNATGRLKNFALTDVPEWVTPSALMGKINAYSGTDLTFAIDPKLAPGTYLDTIEATVDGFPEYLTIEVNAQAKIPNWGVNPGDYTYAMNAVLAFSLDQTDTNLSRDSLDRIAAVFNGEVRGIARLEYVEQFNKYLAFMTIYSNIPANEQIKFRMWRASTGITYAADEVIYFAEQSLIGRIGLPKILHPNGIFQVIPLEQGWNWVSLNVENSNMTIRNLLGSLGSPKVGNNITVKRKDGNTATFTQIATPIIYGNQWTGQLVEMNNIHGYMVHLSDQRDTLYVPGTPITNFANIDVFSGWNWIGYQPQEPKPIGEALGSINTRNQDLVISQEAFSEYHNGSDTWYGPLKFMEPGKGYKLKLRDGRIYNDLVYSRLSKEDFAVDHTRYASSMTLVGSTGLGEQKAESREERQLTEDRLLVGAFIDDTCRGYGYVQWVEFLQEYRVIFSFGGNATDIGRKLTFKVYDTYSGQEFISDREAIYVTDFILGEMMVPFVLFDRLALPEAGYYLEQNYPNPYDAKTNIRFILPEAGQVKLSVYDQFGKEVQVLIEGKLTAGEHTAVFDGSKLPGGVYHYSLQAGEYRASRKMVKF